MMDSRDSVNTWLDGSNMFIYIPVTRNFIHIFSFDIHKMPVEKANQTFSFYLID